MSRTRTKAPAPEAKAPETAPAGDSVELVTMTNGTPARVVPPVCGAHHERLGFERA
jgi:hypothetical protein